jgi:hypothetical protein
VKEFQFHKTMLILFLIGLVWAIATLAADGTEYEEIASLFRPTLWLYIGVLTWLHIRKRF